MTVGPVRWEPWVVRQEVGTGAEMEAEMEAETGQEGRR